MIKLRLAIFSFLIVPARIWITLCAWLIGASVENPIQVIEEDDPPNYGGVPEKVRNPYGRERK